MRVHRPSLLSDFAVKIVRHCSAVVRLRAVIDSVRRRLPAPIQYWVGVAFTLSPGLMCQLGWSGVGACCTVCSFSGCASSWTRSAEDPRFGGGHKSDHGPPAACKSWLCNFTWLRLSMVYLPGTAGSLCVEGASWGLGLQHLR